MIDKDISITRVEVVRDLFLFQCYTGLAYKDLQSLTKNNIQIGIDKFRWIIINRKKTGTLCKIPLLPISEGIIKKYSNHICNEVSDKLFPVPSNQKMNAYLKEVGDICGIHKALHSHLARHTFATTVTLSKGIPMETVSKLLGAITAISACLSTVYGVYDGDKIYSNLYLFVTAAAASGTGKLKFCKRLVNKIHQDKREEAILLENDYAIELADFNKRKGKSNDSKKPKPPAAKMLFIPANNSSTGMFQLLGDNDGRGLIFETEADTLAKNFKTDYGDYSDGFRNAFHHESIKYYRRTDREY